MQQRISSGIFRLRDVALQPGTENLFGVFGPDVFASDDRGATWARIAVGQMETPTECLLSLDSLDFLDNRHGWTAGDCGVTAATADGGRTWALVNRGIPQRKPLSQLAFYSGSEGYAIDNAGTIFFTEDGGRSWEVFIGNEDCYQAVALGHVAQNEVVYFSGDCETGINEYGINNDTTGVMEGEIPKVPAGQIPRGDLLASGWGWLVGEDGRIYWSRPGDPEPEWKARPVEGLATGETLSDVIFSESGSGWLAGDQGTFLVSSDSGLHWTRAGKTPIAKFLWMNELSAVALDHSDQVLFTKDGGRSWSQAQTRLGPT